MPNTPGIVHEEAEGLILPSRLVKVDEAPITGEISLRILLAVQGPVGKVNVPLSQISQHVQPVAPPNLLPELAHPYRCSVGKAFGQGKAPLGVEGPPHVPERVGEVCKDAENARETRHYEEEHEDLQGEEHPTVPGRRLRRGQVPPPPQAVLLHQGNRCEAWLTFKARDATLPEAVQTIQLQCSHRHLHACVPVLRLSQLRNAAGVVFALCKAVGVTVWNDRTILTRLDPQPKAGSPGPEDQQCDAADCASHGNRKPVVGGYEGAVHHVEVVREVPDA
mmetsp:Transcript_15287/g.34738  ORF Transcript_15287/g.34738 Transcript_15287/m.34738 type:complete len:278 (-) Transcript_15287:738-1571(-)